MRFDGLDVFDQLPEAMDIWVDAPWFQIEAVVIGNMCHYYDKDCWLSCGVTQSLLYTFA